MITEFSELDAKGLVKAINDMLEDGEFPVLCGMRVQGCGGMGTLLPSGGMPLVHGQTFARVGVTQFMIPACSHGCMSCPHQCIGSFIQGSYTRLCYGSPIVTVGSVGPHAVCCGANLTTAIEGLMTPVHVEDVTAALF